MTIQLICYGRRFLDKNGFCLSLDVYNQLKVIEPMVLSQGQVIMLTGAKGSGRGVFGVALKYAIKGSIYKKEETQHDYKKVRTLDYRPTNNAQYDSQNYERIGEHALTLAQRGEIVILTGLCDRRESRMQLKQYMKNMCTEIFLEGTHTDQQNNFEGQSHSQEADISLPKNPGSEFMSMAMWQIIGYLRGKQVLVNSLDKKQPPKCPFRYFINTHGKLASQSLTLFNIHPLEENQTQNTSEQYQPIKIKNSYSMNFTVSLLQNAINNQAHDRKVFKTWKHEGDVLDFEYTKELGKGLCVDEYLVHDYDQYRTGLTKINIQEYGPCTTTTEMFDCKLSDLIQKIDQQVEEWKKQNNIAAEQNIDILCSICRGGIDDGKADYKGLANAVIRKNADLENEMIIMPVQDSKQNFKEQITVKTMKFSTHPKAKTIFEVGMDPPTMSGLVCWNIQNSAERKAFTKFNYSMYPGIAFCVPTDDKHAGQLHAKSMSKLFMEDNDPNFVYDFRKTADFQKVLFEKYDAIFGGFGILHDARDNKKYKILYRSGVLNTGFMKEGSYNNQEGNFADDGYHDQGDDKTPTQKTMARPEIILIKGLWLLQWVYGPGALKCIHECYTVDTIVKAYEISIEGLKWPADEAAITLKDQEIFPGVKNEWKTKFDAKSLKPKKC